MSEHVSSELDGATPVESEAAVEAIGATAALSEHVSSELDGTTSNESEAAVEAGGAAAALGSEDDLPLEFVVAPQSGDKCPARA